MPSDCNPTTDKALSLQQLDSPSLEQLENRQLIWRGRVSVRRRQARPTRASGWPELDRQLDGGWPESGLVTIHSPVGIGELRLLFPLWSSDARLSAVIAAPYPLSGEALQGAGLRLEQVLLVQPESEREALWAAEQCLKSGACQSVVLWQRQIGLTEARRLQLAAHEGQCLQFLFLGSPSAAVGLPVELTLRITPNPGGLTLEVPRRKQGWALPPFSVAMADSWPELSLPTRTHPSPAAVPGVQTAEAG